MKDLNTQFRIGELAKATGKSARALRLYEEMGLLCPADRSSGNYRLYGREAVERVRWVMKLQDIGFTLNDIQDAIKAQGDEAPREAMDSVRALFESRLHDVDAQISRLRKLKNELKNGLAYLEGCTGCGIAKRLSCGDCESQPAQPALIRGLTMAAKEGQGHE